MHDMHGLTRALCGEISQEHFQLASSVTQNACVWSSHHWHARSLPEHQSRYGLQMACERRYALVDPEVVPLVCLALITVCQSWWEACSLRGENSHSRLVSLSAFTISRLVRAGLQCMQRRRLMYIRNHIAATASSADASQTVWRGSCALAPMRRHAAL
jgi:hypothetical protein